MMPISANKFFSHWTPAFVIHGFMSSPLKDKWVLITGASAGFGAAGAVAFGREGARLLLGARRVDRLQKAADEARTAGAGETLVHALDVADTQSVNAFVHWVKMKTARLDVLINNAGGAHGLDTIAEGKDEDWETMMQANVLSILRMTRAALPLLPHDAGASIINIGSHADRSPYEGGSAYCGAKAAAAQITRVLRLELCGTGIRVCLIAPGLAETEFSLVRFKGDAARAKKPYEGTFPLVGEDIAQAMVWVASRPSHVNIDELVIKPTDQAAIHKVFRRK
jgi:3-hydroxy acid dehydrogenase/malonic semialdehyde reductase